LKEYAGLDEELLSRHWRVDMVAIEVEMDGSVIRCDHIRDVYPP
jgi:hypothetical protein